MNINCFCATCDKAFIILAKEHRRQLKNGRNRFFCSRTCSSIKNNQENPRKGNPKYLLANNRKDEYSPFRWYVLRAKYRGKKKKYGCDLTVEFLKKLWDEQNGICPLTGWRLLLPKNTIDTWGGKHPYNARIDNSKGYMEGNVRFIAYMANIGRADFSDEQLIYFCQSVANFTSSQELPANQKA